MLFVEQFRQVTLCSVLILIARARLDKFSHYVEKLDITVRWKKLLLVCGWLDCHSWLGGVESREDLSDCHSWLADVESRENLLKSLRFSCWWGAENNYFNRFLHFTNNWSLKISPLWMRYLRVKGTLFAKILCSQIRGPTRKYCTRR